MFKKKFKEKKWIRGKGKFGRYNIWFGVCDDEIDIKEAVGMIQGWLGEFRRVMGDLKGNELLSIAGNFLKEKAEEKGFDGYKVIIEDNVTGFVYCVKGRWE